MKTALSLEQTVRLSEVELIANDELKPVTTNEYFWFPETKFLL